MQRHGAPSQRLDVLHRVTKKIFVGHPRRQHGNREVALFSVQTPGIGVSELDPATSNEIFQNCKWLVHDVYLNRFVIGIRRSRPNALGVILTPGAA